MGLNFVTISLDNSYVKNQFLGPSRVVKKSFFKKKKNLWALFSFFPLFVLQSFFNFFFLKKFSLFLFISSFFDFFNVFHFLFSFFPKK